MGGVQPTPPGGEDLVPVLVRAQYSASIGGHNEPIGGVVIEYRKTGSQTPLIAETNEEGVCYIALERETLYEFSVEYGDQRRSFTLEYTNQTVLLISIDLSGGDIVDCVFLTAKPSSRGYKDPGITTILGFTLHLSHVVSFIMGLLSSLIIYVGLSRRRDLEE